MKILIFLMLQALLSLFVHSSAPVNVTCSVCENGCNYQQCYRVMGNNLDSQSCYPCLSSSLFLQLKLLNCQYDLFTNICDTGACYLPVDNICYSVQQGCPSAWVSVTCSSNCRTSSCSRCLVTQTPSTSVQTCIDSCDGAPNFNTTLVPCSQDFKGSSCSCCTTLTANTGVCTNNLPYLNNDEVTRWAKANYQLHLTSAFITLLFCFMTS